MKKILISMAIVCLYSISSLAGNANQNKEKFIKTLRDNHYFLQTSNILPDDMIAPLKLRVSQTFKIQEKKSSGCSSYNSQCEKINNPFIHGNLSNRVSITTPSDVYCFSKKTCCDTYKKAVNAESFCECYAQYYREQSYNWEHIDNSALLKISFLGSIGDACKNEKNAIDHYMDIDEVYNKIFSLCDSKISDKGYCDKLAQTTKYLIHSELIEQELAQRTELDSATFFLFLQMRPYSFYVSKYDNIITSDEFKALLQY